MKKRLTALLTTILCMTASISAISANAVEPILNDDGSYTIATDKFTYNTKGFQFESEIAKPDFLVVGIEYCADDSGKVSQYIVSSIKTDNPNTGSAGAGIMSASTVKYLMGDVRLQIGDLLQFEGGYESLGCIPPEYIPFGENEPDGLVTKAICLGSGVDLFGEEFADVMRMQSIFDQNEYIRDLVYTSQNPEDAKDIDWGGVKLTRGDVNLDDELDILDCISVNKYLLGSSNFCFYTKNLADVNMDGTLDSTDSLAILKEVVGLTTDFK